MLAHKLALSNQCCCCFFFRCCYCCCDFCLLLLLLISLFSLSTRRCYSVLFLLLLFRPSLLLHLLLLLLLFCCFPDFAVAVTAYVIVVVDLSLTLGPFRFDHESSTTFEFPTSDVSRDLTSSCCLPVKKEASGM